MTTKFYDKTINNKFLTDYSTENIIISLNVFFNTAGYNLQTIIYLMLLHNCVRKHTSAESIYVSQFDR